MRVTALSNTVSLCRMQKDTVSGKNEFAFGAESKASSNEKKPKLPWEKIITGSILFLAAASIYYSKKNPVKKQIQKEYEKIFSSNNIEKRVFPAIPKRDEVIISEAIKGNNRAVKLFPTLKTENPEAVVYTSRIKSKIERNEAMLKEGCFRTCTPKRSEEEVLSDQQKNLKKLKAKFNFLHKKYVLPLTQN